MKINLLLAALYATCVVCAFPSLDTTALSLQEAEAAPEAYSALEKRRGGGGGKGGGGGSGGGSSGGKGGSGSSGSSGSSGGRPASSYSFSPTSNAGGRTQQGSGLKPSYSGGRYVGATVPYTAGARSPTRGIAPYAIAGAGLGAFAFFPGIWLYGLYAYPYGLRYNHTYDNGTTVPANVTCLCQQYQVCGCDPTDNATFVNQVVNNGTSAPVNTSTVRYVTFDNGTQAAYINGSLPNGTTASGGTDPSNASEISAGVRIAQAYGGYAAMAAIVVGSVLI